MNEKRVCPTCLGVGFIYHEETDVSELCNCKIAEMMLSHLKVEIFHARTILKSPLFELPKTSGDPLVLDRTTDNLHIKCVWNELLSHLKLCLWAKGLNFRFHILTDERIKNVFVGNESYKARSKSRRDEMTTFNSLSDLVGADYDFVIIQLGHLGYKNIAAAGALKEALMIRRTSPKPTWLIEEPDRPFSYECHSWSEDLQAYVDQHFEVVDLDREKDEAPKPRGRSRGMSVENVGDTEAVTSKRLKVQAPMPSEDEPSNGGSFGIEMPGDNQERDKWKKKSNWKPKKDSSGGGGPV